MSPSWTVAEPTLPALTFTYTFGPGTAKSLALVVNGGVVLVSPPCNPVEETFAGLAAHGALRALVAPNAFHTMGLAAWKQRFPDVPVFAPVQAIPRVGKQSKIADVRPLAEAQKLVGDRVELVEMPHYKTGEVLVRWPIESGWAWYLTDVAMNLTQHVPGLFGTIFRWTKSTPGFRRNAIAGMFMMKDKQAVYAWLRAEAEKKPPRHLVMCHGDDLRPADPVAEVAAALA